MSFQIHNYKFNYVECFGAREGRVNCPRQKRWTKQHRKNKAGLEVFNWIHNFLFTIELNDGVTEGVEHFAKNQLESVCSVNNNIK